jgi:glycosyltransferase involved in cell wall biosynthesis
MNCFRDLTVGIFFNARREQGGLFQYANTVVHCLNRFGGDNRYVLFWATPEPLPDMEQTAHWQVSPIPRSQMAPRLVIEMLLMLMARAGLSRPIRLLPQYSQPEFRRIDLMLYVKPSLQAFQWPYPFVFPIHDLQHLHQGEFPEVSANGERSRREFLYQNSVPPAAGILTDSQVGRQDVIEAYGADPSRVHVLPYLAPAYLSGGATEDRLVQVKARYNLPDGYLFYPAAFWPHKNHARLIKAIGKLRDRHGLHVELALAGSRSHEYPRLMRLAGELGLQDQIHFLGYVPDEDVYPLYRMASTLVMPTFFGPTNIPIIEAWSMGCPVITSDIRGIREQVGEAALLADPRDEEDIAEKIRQLLQSERLADDLIEAGRRKVAAWTPADFAARLEQILSLAAESKRERTPAAAGEDDYGR